MATEQVDRELNQLKSDIADLRRDISSLVHSMKDAGIDQGKQAYNRAYESARRAGDAVRKRASDATSTLEREVEEHPFTSVAAAFGTGFVVGMLLDRRHHH